MTGPALVTAPPPGEQGQHRQEPGSKGCVKCGARTEEIDAGMDCRPRPPAAQQTPAPGTVIEWGAQLSEGLTLLRGHTLPALLRALVAAGPEGAALSAAPLEELAKAGRELAEELGTLAGAVAHLAGAQQRAAEYWQSLRRAVADDQSPAPAECSP